MTTTVWLVRHGETTSYAADSGLTALGAAQSHDRGVALAAQVGPAAVRVLTAPSNRARATAAQLRGALQERRPPGAPEIAEPQEWAEFANFAVATPQGPREPTDAFADFAAARERHEREGAGPPPGWVRDTGRFWGAQRAGEDPIRFWLTVPLLHFEPPAVCVRRFWRGVRRAAGSAEHVVVATHSGPIRAFATAALGEDLGEPHNAEAVVVQVDAGGGRATVSYRERSEALRVPEVEGPAPWDGAAPAS